MREAKRRMPGFVRISLLFAGMTAAAWATQSAAPEVLAAEEKRTEEIQVERIEAAHALLAVRSIAGTREIEVRGLHTLSIHDTPGKLLLARRVVELLDHGRSVSHLHGASRADEETMIASYALRDTTARDAMRMLMGRIAIRKVAAIEENATVVFRDTVDQVKAAFDLLEEFDRVAP